MTDTSVMISTRENVALGIIQELCNELRRKNINYCHWKSNAAIERSATGENDLDLLVSTADVDAFTTILTGLDFKPAIEHPQYRLPGILDFFGHDRESGRLVHVHAHYQLVLGHDATKNYRIPVEEAYLASASLDGLFRLPSKEFELIILVIRLILKHSTWDTLLMRQGKLSPSERSELDYLLRDSSNEKISKILAENLPFIDQRLFEACLHILISDASTFQRALIGQRMVSRLKPYARRPQWIDSLLKLWRRVYWPVEKKIFHIDDRKKVGSGGLIVAIVGGDGSGKTTVVEEIYQWLSTDYDVYRFHMGKPDWSLLTVIVRGLLKVGRSLGFYPFMRAEIVYSHDPALLSFPGYPWLIREICTGRDRLLTYRKARHLASQGNFVILDRFPMTQIKFMDGPQVARMTVNTPDSRLKKTLIQMEENIYQKITLPDLIILLLADPEIACRRKVTEIEEEVRSRTTEIWEIDWQQTPAHVIDANRTKHEVLSDVKEVIWSRM